MPPRISITYTKLLNCVAYCKNINSNVFVTQRPYLVNKDVDLRYMKSGIQEPPLEEVIPKQNRLFDELFRDFDQHELHSLPKLACFVLQRRKIFFSVKFESDKLSFITSSGGSTIGRGGATGGNSIDALAAAKNKITPSHLLNHHQSALSLFKKPTCKTQPVNLVFSLDNHLVS